MSNANVTEHSLNYVYNLWESLSKQLALPSVGMILNDISEGIIPMETEPPLLETNSQTAGLKRKVCCLQMYESVGEK